LLAPGHPLLDAVVDVILERFQPLLKQGAILVDETDASENPRLLVYLEHAIRDGRTARSGEPRVISQRLQFIHLTEDGRAIDGGSAPYLDYRPLSLDERAALLEVIEAPWLSAGVEDRALSFAIAMLVPNHLAEVKKRRVAEIDKVEREVRTRLNREINYWDARAARLREDERAGKDQRINAQNAEATAGRMVERLHKRQSELERERQITAMAPILRGAVLVIPRGLLGSRHESFDQKSFASFAADAAARAEVERLAMAAVMAHERDLGHTPRDVSAEKKGWDVESLDTGTGHLRFIEVKGRHSEARDVIITKNEILASLNAPDAFHLALVGVENGRARRPIYVQRFFQRELGFAETAVVFNIADLVSLAPKHNFQAESQMQADVQPSPGLSEIRKA
jgi:hypothetical protein